eukprot:702880-Alexandrium_andersonii.AAC.1
MSESLRWLCKSFHTHWLDSETSRPRPPELPASKHRPRSQNLAPDVFPGTRMSSPMMRAISTW